MTTPIGPLRASHALIVELQIVDTHRAPVSSPYTLTEGANVFRCLATYVDGSVREYSPFWTCPVPLRSGDFDVWCVLGRSRRDEVTIHASARQERYLELACWVFEPNASERNDFPSIGISFDYSHIDELS